MVRRRGNLTSHVRERKCPGAINTPGHKRAGSTGNRTPLQLAYPMEYTIVIYFDPGLQNHPCEPAVPQEVTEVKIRVIEDPPSRCVAFATITLDGWFVVRDIRLIHGDRENPSRYFLIFPKRGTDLCPTCASVTKSTPHNGRTDDVAHPINQEARDQITAAVVGRYLKSLNTANLTPNYGYGRYETHKFQAATCTA